MRDKLLIVLLLVTGAFGAPQKPNVPRVPQSLPHSKGSIPSFVETPIESCPQGYVMENGVCVQRIQVPKVPFCNEPAVYHDGHCLIVSPPLKQCQPGYELSGKQCTATRTALQQPSCPPGTIIQGDQCLSSFLIDTICPQGFVDNGQDCVAFSKPEKSCPPGFLFSGKQCLQSDTAPPNPECPPGTILDNGTCRLVQHVDTICPPGFVEEGNSCVQYLPANKMCPPGFNLSGQQCVAPQNAELEPLCPPNTVFESGKCKVVKTVDMVCPTGYTDSGDECVLYVAPAKECPPNFTLEGLQCIQTTNTPTQQVCPPGTVLQDNTCVSVQTIDAVCPPEFIENGRDCVKFSPVSKECPPGFLLSGNRCILVQTAPLEAECPQGTILKNNECQSTERIDTICAPGYIDNGQDCVQFASPEKACPTGFSLSGKQCVKTKTAPRVPSCPPGTKVEGNTCIATEIIDAVCPPGFLENGDDCIQFAQPGRNCPSGYALTGKQCSQSTQVPPQPECPPGTNLVNGQCQRVEHINLVCPPGFLDNGINCVAFSAPKKDCPVGYSLVGPHCENVREAPLISECPPGYNLQGSQCTALKLIDSICPDGFLSNGDNCIQFSPASTVCPTGFLLQGQQCIQSQYSPKSPECPPGSILDGDSCVRLIPGSLQYVCPAGNREGDVCVERKIFNPSLECPPGYLLEGGKQCVRRAQYDCSITTYVTECKTPDVKTLRRLAGKDSQVAHEGHGHNHGQGHNHGHANANYPTIHTQHHKEAPRPICEDVPKITPKTCNKADSVPAVPICEGRAELLGKECVLSNYYPLEAICQDGSKSKECAKYVKVPPKLVCPIGTVEVGNQCQKNIFAPYDLACPNGFSLVGDKCAVIRDRVCPNDNCQRLVTAAPSNVCPPGYKQTGAEAIFENYGHHRHLAEATVTRGHGHGHHHGHSRYVPNSVVATYPQVKPVQPIPAPTIAPIVENVVIRCIHIESSPYSLQCPPGARLIADKCAIHSDKTCPNGNCERVYTEPANLTCPPGFQPIGENNKLGIQSHSHHHQKIQSKLECVKTISVPYIITCNPPFLLEGDKCVERVEKICLQGDCRRQIVISPSYACPPGFRNASGIQAVAISGHKHGHIQNIPQAECIQTIFEEYQLVCNQGFTLMGDRCASFSDKICPNGNCERLISQPTILVCPQGYTKPSIGANGHSHGHNHAALVSTDCIKNIYSPYDLSCAPNYEIVGDKCATYTAKVCPNGNCEQLLRTPPSIECPPGYYKPQAGVSIRASGHSHSHMNKLASNNQCIRNIYEPYQLVCPNGFRLLGDMCQQSTVKVCPNNSCERVSYTSPIPTCPYGFERSGQRCIANEYADYELSCPPGLIVINDKCSKSTEKVCPNGDCERSKTFPPDLVCPPGYTMEAGVTVGNPKVFSATTGYHHGSGHHHHSTATTQSVVKTTVCMREVFSPYSLNCPAESELLGDRCAVFTAKVCPSGGCDKTTSVPINKSCPMGFVTDNDGTCYIVEYAPFALTCNEPYTLFDNKECVLVTKPETRCPEGTDATSSGCIKKVITTPIVSYETTCIGPNCDHL